MPRAKRERDRYLWAVDVRGGSETFWILAGERIESAQRKAERFFERLATKYDKPPYVIKSIKSHGTIDVF